MIDEILSYNQKFVSDKGYEPYATTKYPDKKIAIVSCMDTRLTQLLMAALGIKNGDVKMIKMQEALFNHPLTVPYAVYSLEFMNLASKK